MRTMILALSLVAIGVRCDVCFAQAPPAAASAHYDQALADIDAEFAKLPVKK